MSLYVRQCPWTQDGIHTFETDSLVKLYCSKSCRRKAVHTRQLERKYAKLRAEGWWFEGKHREAGNQHLEEAINPWRNPDGTFFQNTKKPKRKRRRIGDLPNVATKKLAPEELGLGVVRLIEIQVNCLQCGNITTEPSGICVVCQ